MVTFRVPDMTCGRCASKIARALAAADPAARVEFDLGRQLVTIAPASAAVPELAAVIQEAGYSAAAVDASPATRRAGSCGCGCGPTKAAAVDVRQAPARAKGGCCA